MVRRFRAGKFTNRDEQVLKSWTYELYFKMVTVVEHNDVYISN